ncbi:hypothetical protein DIZ27_44055 [Streptomyces sp. NWU339]|nr:hypothetical protein DIZ27_44055 [Streptomyces sp. NWU339]
MRPWPAPACAGAGHGRKPLKATARSDAQSCSKACAQAERRWRRHYAKAVEFGFLLIAGRTAEASRRCRACGRRSSPATATAAPQDSAGLRAGRPPAGPGGRSPCAKP